MLKKMTILTCLSVGAWLVQGTQIEAQDGPVRQGLRRTGQAVAEGTRATARATGEAVRRTGQAAGNVARGTANTARRATGQQPVPYNQRAYQPYQSGYRGVQQGQAGYAAQPGATWTDGRAYTLRHDSMGREFICVNGRRVYFDSGSRVQGQQGQYQQGQQRQYQQDQQDQGQYQQGQPGDVPPAPQSPDAQSDQQRGQQQYEANRPVDQSQDQNLQDQDLQNQNRRNMEQSDQPQAGAQGSLDADTQQGNLSSESGARLQGNQADANTQSDLEGDLSGTGDQPEVPERGLRAEGENVIGSGEEE